MPSLAASLTAVAAVATLALTAPTARAANCTTAEATAIAALDKVLEDNAECARLNSLVPGEVTTLQICSDTDCVRLVKKAASSVPDCLIDGESAQRISLVAFKSCSVSNETTTPTPTTSAPTSTPSTSSSVGSDSDVQNSTTASPAPTTAAPKSGAATVTVSTVVVASAASLLLSAWL